MVDKTRPSSETIFTLATTAQTPQPWHSASLLAGCQSAEVEEAQWKRQAGAEAGAGQEHTDGAGGAPELAGGSGRAGRGTWRAAWAAGRSDVPVVHMHHTVDAVVGVGAGCTGAAAGRKDLRTGWTHGNR